MNKRQIESLRTNKKYDQIQEQQILDVINLQPYKELEKFSISKMRLKKIENYKMKNGNIETLDEILELDGFGEVVLEKFCDSILLSSEENKNPTEEKPLAMKTTKKDSIDQNSEVLPLKMESYCSPVLLENIRKNIRTIVAIQADLKYISWTKLSLGEDNESIVTEEWDNYQVGEEDKKLSLPDLIQIMININEKIPSADVYVFEAMQSLQAQKQPGNILQVNVNVQRAQLFAMMTSLMAARCTNHSVDSVDSQSKDEKSKQQHIFLLKNFLPSRLYRILIGTERVATEHVINEIFQQNTMGNHEVHIPFEFKQLYKEETRISREYLGQSMIIGLTFFKLCLLRCKKSIRQLNSRKKQ